MADPAEPSLALMDDQHQNQDDGLVTLAEFNLDEINPSVPLQGVHFQLNVRDVPYYVPVQIKVIFDHTNEDGTIEEDDSTDFFLIARNQIIIIDSEGSFENAEEDKLSESPPGCPFENQVVPESPPPSPSLEPV